MNRHGAILHWIMFGILIAMGIFFVASNLGQQQVEQKGKWSLDFLEQNYAEAEKRLLTTTIIGKKAGVNSALELASRGGFLADELTFCGKVGEIYLWNKESTFCSPNIKHNLPIVARAQLVQELPGKEFSALDYSGTVFFGKGPLETISTPGASYTFENSFAVDLGYSFEEYAQLENDARQLLSTCKDQDILGTCVNGQKPTYWHYHSCFGPEVIPSSTRILDFCVTSPTDAMLNGNLVQYRLALDFTPSTALMVTDFSVEHIGSQYQITFRPQTTADSYLIHYTDWQQVAGKSGDVEDIFSTMPSTVGLFHKTVAVENPTTVNCPADKVPGTTYLCLGETNSIMYVLEDTAIQLGQTYLAVTSVRNDQESKIGYFCSGEGLCSLGVE